MTAPLRVLVLQWAHEGRATELAAVEDGLVAVAESCGARVTRERGARLRDVGPDDPPDEVHLLEFDDDAQLDAFLAHPDRGPLVPRLRDVLQRTQVVRLLPG